MVLSTKLDQELLTGGGGFMAAANPAIAAPGAPGAVAKYADYLAGCLGPGRWPVCRNVAGVRILLGPSAYKHALSGLPGGHGGCAVGGDESALERIQQLSGGVRASSHIPPVDTKIEQALAARATGLTHMVQPVWQGPTLIVDEVTRADSGEIVSHSRWSVRPKAGAGGWLRPRRLQDQLAPRRFQIPAVALATGEECERGSSPVATP